MSLNNGNINVSSDHPNKTRPLISFILVGRNDNYGGDFKIRLQQCISNLYIQLRQYKVESEIIFVNYNPLTNSDIINFINWPLSNQYTKVRIITVPPLIHQQFLSENNVKDVPVLEYPAKNTGIRRAKGEYILSMNPDILINDNIIKNIKTSLRPNKYYRADRIDFKYKKNKMVFSRIFLKGHIESIKNDFFLNLYFLKLINTLKNVYPRNSIYFESFLKRLRVPVDYGYVDFKYHCNASGDFMLMHREKWFKLMAYKENAYISLHIDSLMVVQAATLGLQEKIFRNPIYHQEHERRYDAEKENVDSKIAYKIFQKEAEKMLQEKSPIIYNDHNWGFAHFILEEVLV